MVDLIVEAEGGSVSAAVISTLDLRFQTSGSGVCLLPMTAEQELLLAFLPPVVVIAAFAIMTAVIAILSCFRRRALPDFIRLAAVGSVLLFVNRQSYVWPHPVQIDNEWRRFRAVSRWVCSLLQPKLSDRLPCGGLALLFPLSNSDRSHRLPVTP